MPSAARRSSHCSPTPVIHAIAVRANAARNGRDAEFDDALNAFCDEHNRGPAGAARFEKEYLVAIGTRV